MQSSDNERQYTVKILSLDCQGKPNCLPQCAQKECSYLCRHMISCTCYDYQHGHLCKHTHKAHAIHNGQLDMYDGSEHGIIDEPLDIGVAPSKSKRDESGIHYT